MTTVRYTTIKGEVIAEKRNGARRLYVPDPLGSTVALLDNTQTQVDTFSYWPYGEVRTSTGATPPPFQFVGTAGYYADSVGRTYVRARYLHSQKGRWLTQNPLRFSSEDANLYRYVANMPTVKTDASGTQGKKNVPTGTNPVSRYWVFPLNNCSKQNDTRCYYHCVVDRGCSTYTCIQIYGVGICICFSCPMIRCAIWV